MRFRPCFASSLLLVSSAFGAAPADEPTIEVGKGRLDFRHGKELFTRYVISDKAAKPYFWPVYALPGVTATRAWPMADDPEVKRTDHPHQKSLWFCHGDVVPEGIDFKKHFRNVAGIDFWSEGKGHGKIVCVKVGKPQTEGNHATVTTANEWRTAEGQKVLDETRTITYYHFGRGANLLVLDIDLVASVVPVTFADTKEGSLGVRVREKIRVDRGGQLTNAEGKKGEGRGVNADKSGCWGLVSAWCDNSGQVEDKQTVGVAVFADPGNPIDTAWHARNYGLLAANPFGRDKHARFPDRKGNDTPVKLAKGEHLKLRYGVFVHAGDVEKGKVADYYARFVKLGGKAK
jgi:hypothetical protein